VRQKVLSGLLATLALPGLFGAGPATAAGPADPAITYLMSEYAVSQAEAERRLKLQADAYALHEQLAGQHPGQYLGMWLDQANGGVLRIGMTDPGLVPKLPGVAAYRAKRSMRELRATAQKVSAVAGNAATWVDPATESIVVNRAGSTLVGLTTARAAALVPVRVNERVPDELKCSTLYCGQAPLLGGLRLDIQRDDLSVGGCSLGYQLQSAITKDRFVLVAGHCTRSATHTHVDNAVHQWFGPRLPVAVEGGATDLLAEIGKNMANPGGYDYAILPIDPDGQDFWIKTVWAAVVGARQPAQSVYYNGKLLPISGFTAASSALVGSTVCASGSGYTPPSGVSYVDSGAGLGYEPGTHCGTVTASDESHITVRICARRGDSGGPLYDPVTRKALGILSSGHARSGACVPGDTELNMYEPVSRLLARVNDRTGNQYQFELVPQPEQRIIRHVP
jgi:streptogrisin C